MGKDGVLLQHEYFLYIFDATLMFGVMVLFNVWHPSKIIERSKKEDMSDFQEQGHQYSLEQTSAPILNKGYDRH